MKEITIGRFKYQINYSQEVADQVLNKVIEWMEHKNHYASYSGEALFQDDDCIIDAPELISDIVDGILKPICLNDEEE